MSATKASLKPYWQLGVRYLTPQRLWLGLLAALILGSIGVRLANPQVIRRFIDLATQTSQAGPAPEAQMGRAALLFLGLAVLQQVFSVAVAYLGRNIGWHATNALRIDLARHCLGLDMSFHNVYRPGEMIERIDGDVEALTNFFSQFIVQIVGAVLLLLGALILLFVTDWRAGTAIAVFCFFALLIMLRLQNFGAGLWQVHREASADLFGFLEERLAGTEDIRSCGAKAYVMRRLYQLTRTAYQKFVRAGTIGAGITHNTAGVLFGLGSVTALAVSAYLYNQGAFTTGTVYMVLHYSTLISWPIEQISRQMRDLQRAGAGVARVRGLLAIESRLQDRPTSEAGALPAEGGALAVVFQNVSFGYEPERRRSEGEAPARPDPEDESQAKEMVLHDLDFSLPPGRVLGLLGRTGSGKTTLSRLLFRLYDPDRGSVCLGGESGAPVDIRTLSLAELRRRVGVVTQDVQLFQASVRDNLTFFNPAVPDERIRGAIEDLGLGTWLAALPKGLDTELASGGGGLSAGEAQLLALTRILLQDPGLIILDEASSRLDPATERLIEHAVDKLIYGRTAIIIAHRLRTVQRADAIMILEHGQICEVGAREALAQDPGSRFYQLLQTGLEEVLV